MSEVNDYATVVEKLLDRTRQGKVPWEAYSYGFRTRVGSYEFRIAKSEDRGDITISLGMLDDNNNEIFEVSLTDDPVTLGKHRQEVSALKELHELARRNALRVEEKVGEVSGLLDQL